MKAKEISEFTMQIALLLGAGIPLESGLSVMAEDADSQKKKDMYNKMAEDIQLGVSLGKAMRDAGEFPEYLVEMSEVGYRTGTLERVMESLSDYYAREHRIGQSIKNAVTYPLMMVFMLLVVLFVLMSRVMPVFEDVYRQLGTEISPVTQKAAQIGTYITGAGIIAVIAVVLAVTVLSVSGKKTDQGSWFEKALVGIYNKGNIAAAMAKRRISSVMAISLTSGLKLEEGMEMAAGMIKQESIKNKLMKCKEDMEHGESMYDAIKNTGIFSGMDMQMIKVGNKAGKADRIFAEMTSKYEEQVNDSVENMIGKFEPTIVIVLAVVVGIILLAVMMPLVSIMASIGV